MQINVISFQEKEALESRLNALQSKVDMLVRDYPIVARTVGFISSNQSVAGNNNQMNVTTVHVPAVSLGELQCNVCLLGVFQDHTQFWWIALLP